MKDATFSAKLTIIEDMAVAGLPAEYKNPLLTWVKLVFADDQPNANKQGIGKDEGADYFRKIEKHMR